MNSIAGDRDVSSIDTGGGLAVDNSSIGIRVASISSSKEQGRISISITLANEMTGSIASQKSRGSKGAVGGNSRSSNNRGGGNSRGGDYGGGGRDNRGGYSSTIAIASIAKTITIGIGVSIATIEDRGIGISISITLSN